MANTRFRSETGLYVTGSAGSTAEIETILNVSNSVTVSESTTLNALNVDGVTNISNTFYITTDLPTTFNEGVTLLSTSANSNYGALTVYDVDLQGTPSNTVRIGDLFQNATSTSDTWVVVGETDANTFSVKDLNGTAQPPNGSYKIIRPAEPVILNVSSGGYTANLSVRGTGVFLDGDVHTVTGDLIVQTNLVVQGDQIQVGELLYDGDIVSSTDGLVIGGANSSGEMDASHFPWTVYTQGVWLGNTSNFNTSTHTGTIAISPTVSGEYSLGTGSYYWKNVYANNITVSETLLPLADGDDLGSTGKRWDIFGQTLDIETSVLKATGTGVGIGTSTITANYPLNVGANAQFSKDVFVNSANVTATTLRAVTSVVPTADDAGAVGNSSLTWASGQFTNFTVDNILTVPNYKIDSAVYLGTTSVPTDRTSGTLTLGGIQLNQTSAIIANTSTGDNEYKLLFSDSTGIVNTYIHFLRDSGDGVYTYNPSDNRLSVTNIASGWIGIGSNVSDARTNGQLNSENLRIMGASVSGASVDNDTHLVIDSGVAAGNVAIALLSSNTAFPQINFGRVGDTDIAGIIYDQAANTMNFTVKGTINRLKITSLGIETPRIDVGGNIVPDTDGNYAIGNSSLKFSSAYFGGAVTAGTFTDGTFSVTSGTITGATWNGNIIASAYLDGDTAHLSGAQTFTGDKTFSGDVTFNKAGTADTLVNVIAEDTKVAGLFIGGSSQGTGYIEVGQSTSYGGGIVYEGDDNPGSFANSGVTGSLSDKLVYYRKNNGTRSAVFYNDYNSSDVTFVGSITASNLSGTHSGTNTGDVSLAGGYNYITISGQTITRNQIDLAEDVTGTLPVGNGGTGATTFTQYGILYGDAANAIKVTGAGSSGQILKSNGTAPPDWINQSLIDAGKVDGKDFGTFSGAGGVLYATSTASANGIAAGTTGQVLVSGGSGAPTWTNQSGLGVDFASLTNKLSGTNDYSTNGDLVSGRGSGGVALTINDNYGNANITWNHQNGTPEQDGNAARIEVNTDGQHEGYDWSNPTLSSANLVQMTFELKSGVPNGVAGQTSTAMALREDQLNLGTYNTKLIANDYEPTANNTGSIGTTNLRYDTAFVDDLTVTNNVNVNNVNVVGTLNIYEGSHYLKFDVAANLTTADKTLTFDVNNANRTLTISGDATISGTNTGDQIINSSNGITGGSADAGADVTLSLDFSSLTDMTGDISGTTEFILQNGTTESRKAASEIKLSNFNNDSGWTSNIGDITGVTAGTGLSGGGTSGAVSLALDFSELTDMTGDISGTTEFILQNGTTESRKAASEIKLSNFNNDSGWTSNAGTVTGTGFALGGRVAIWDSLSNLTNDGDLTFGGNTLTIGDAAATGNALTISHDTDSIISHQDNTAGNDLIIRSVQDVFIQSGNGSGSYENAVVATNNAAVSLYHSGSTKLSTISTGISVTGEIRATGDITAYYSDERLKTNLGNIANALDKVKSLNGFYYKPNALAQSFGYKDEMHVGVSAQQVEKILPEVVKLAPFDHKEELENGEHVSKSGESYKTVQYDKLVPLLIQAIKEQDEKINRLESVIEQLLSK